MNQAILLLKAHRRKLLPNLGYFVVFTPLVLLFALIPVSISSFYRTTKDTVALGHFELLLVILSEHMFLITVVLAAAASLLQPIKSFQRALTKLPVPVAPRQLAYLPLATTLAHWAIAQLFLHGLLVAGWLLTGKGTPVHATLEAFAALPLGLLFVLLSGRTGRGPNQSNNSLLLFFIWMVLPTLDDATQATVAANLETAYTFLVVFIVPLLVLMIWELPLYVQRYYKATFTKAPNALAEITLREPLAPQRFRMPSLVVDAISFFFECVGAAAFLVYFVVIFARPLQLDHVGRMPLWAEQTLYGLTIVFVIGAILFFCGKQAILLMQQEKIATHPLWAQWLLRIAYVLERGFTWRREIGKETVRYAPGEKRYRLHFEPLGGDTTAAKLLWPFYTPGNSNRAARSFAVSIIVCVFIMSAMYGGYTVNWDRGGANVAGAPQPLPESPYEINGAYAQHYVTLSLPEEPAFLDRYALYNAVQDAAAQFAGPEQWLAGLDTLTGEQPTVPDKYRIEIASPDPGKLVIQGIGLHWAPAGHLAYALGRHITELLPDGFDIAFDSKYLYHRPYKGFEQVYGFLDNGIHWLPPEGASGEFTDAQPPLPTDTPVFVDLRNTGWWKNGKSWKTAYNTIQEGINAAYRRRVASVWVAGGVYDNARYGKGSLFLKYGIHVYGGFAGTETNRNQRDIQANPTVIDGSFARDGEPAYHVVVGAQNSTLDGFTITGGVADGPDYLEDGGGGLQVEDCSMSVANCVFLGNEAAADGGAINVTDGALDINRCEFRQNTSFDSGGALSLPVRSSVVIRNTVFEGNTATEYGSAIGLIGESLQLENCLFINNGTQGYDDTLFFSSQLRMVNCTVVGTGRPNGRVYAGTGEDLQITNTIIWNVDRDFSDTKATVRHSILPGGAPGEGNMDVDPLFVDPEHGDYRLRSDSPAIDAGTLDGAPDTDLNGTPRPQGKGIDIGAYEYVEP